jgi:hypothetical protein
MVKHYSTETALIKRKPPSARGKKKMPAMESSTFREPTIHINGNGHDHSESADARAELRAAIKNVEHIKDEIDKLKADVEECKQDIYDFYSRERKRLEKEGLTLHKHEADADTDEIRKLREERKGLEAEVRQHEKKLKAAKQLAEKAAYAVIRAEGHAKKVYEEACQLVNKLNSLLPEAEVCLRRVIKRPDDPHYFQSLPVDDVTFFENLSSFVSNPLGESFFKTDKTPNAKIVDYANRLVQDPDASF